MQRSTRRVSLHAGAPCAVPTIRRRPRRTSRLRGPVRSVESADAVGVLPLGEPLTFLARQRRAYVVLVVRRGAFVSGGETHVDYMSTTSNLDNHRV